jgi:hypothetical protein
MRSRIEYVTENIAKTFLNRENAGKEGASSPETALLFA